MGIKVLIYTHTDGSSKSNTSPFALLLVGIPLGLSSMLLALQPDTCVAMNACRGVDLPGWLGRHVRRAVPLDGGYMLHCKSPALPGARLGFPVREDKRGSSLARLRPHMLVFFTRKYPTSWGSMTVDHLKTSSIFHGNPQNQFQDINYLPRTIKCQGLKSKPSLIMFWTKALDVRMAVAKLRWFRATQVL